MTIDNLISRLENAHDAEEDSISVIRAVGVTVAEIQTAIDAFPQHPKAEIFRRAIQGKNPVETLYCDRADILGIAKGLAVVVEQTYSPADGVVMHAKKLGKSIAGLAASAAAAPSSLPAESEPQPPAFRKSKG